MSHVFYSSRLTGQTFTVCSVLHLASYEYLVVPYSLFLFSSFSSLFLRAILYDMRCGW